MQEPGVSAPIRTDAWNPCASIHCNERILPVVCRQGRKAGCNSRARASRACLHGRAAGGAGRRLPINRELRARRVDTRPPHQRPRPRRTVHTHRTPPKCTLAICRFWCVAGRRPNRLARHTHDAHTRTPTPHTTQMRAHIHTLSLSLSLSFSLSLSLSHWPLERALERTRRCRWSDLTDHPFCPPAELASFEAAGGGGRVTLSPVRVTVERSRGSILYAHLLNFRQLEVCSGHCP